VDPLFRLFYFLVEADKVTIGVMEYWSIGVMERIPALQHSITPFNPSK
jgi:hypothetical protein